jgi:hypothetical protein
VADSAGRFHEIAPLHEFARNRRIQTASVRRKIPFFPRRKFGPTE